MSQGFDWGAVFAAIKNSTVAPQTAEARRGLPAVGGRGLVGSLLARGRAGQEGPNTTRKP